MTVTPSEPSPDECEITARLKWLVAFFDTVER